MRAVGVQLYGEAHVLHAAQQVGQLPVQQRLAAGEGHAVEEAAPLFEEIDESRVVHDGLGAAVDQLEVVAERAAEIAPAQKHRARHAAGVIEQGHFLEAVDFHDGNSFREMMSLLRGQIGGYRNNRNVIRSVYAEAPLKGELPPQGAEGSE